VVAHKLRGQLNLLWLLSSGRGFWRAHNNGSDDPENCSIGLIEHSPERAVLYEKYRRINLFDDGVASTG
jgi:hypothetical protein